MVDVQIVRRAAELAAPPVSFEHLITKGLVLSQRELQPRPFLKKFTHDLPWAPHEFFPEGDTHLRLQGFLARLIFRGTFLSLRPRENRRRSFRGNSPVIYQSRA